MFWKWLSQKDNGVYITVQVTPRSSFTKFADLSNDKCRVKVNAPPTEGEANKRLIEYFAKVFNVPKTNISLNCGKKSKIKTFKILEISLEDAIRCIISETNLSTSDRKNNNEN